MSTPSRYARGRAKEYAAKAVLESLGYEVTRAASSKGLADLIAIRHDGVRMVQVKLTSTIHSFCEDKNIQTLRDLPVPYGVTKELWIYGTGIGLDEIRDLSAPKPDRRSLDGQAIIAEGKRRAQELRDRAKAVRRGTAA